MFIIKGIDHIVLRTTCIDKMIQIARYGERYGTQGIGYSFYINDPEGNEVELCEAKH